MRELYVIYLQTTAKKQQESLAALQRIIAHTFAEMASHIVVVDNAIAAPHEERIADNVTLIAGDNRCREFSGMDCGIAWLKSKGNVPPDAVILLANDTFTHDLESHDYYCLDPRQTLRLVDENRLLGHVDCLVTPVELFGISIDRWIRSNFVLCSYGVLTRIAPLSLPVPDDALFSDSPAEFFRPSAPLSPFSQTLLKRILEGRPNIALWKWHSASRISPENFQALKLKAKAVLCEFRLSAKARQSGFELADLSRRSLPSKRMFARIRLVLYVTAAWRLVPRFRRRFAA